MHVGVVGAGAIGGYLAAELSAASTKVTLLRRAATPGGHTPDVAPAAISGGRTPDVARAGGGASAGRPVAVRADGRFLEPSDSMVVTADPAALGAVDVCLVAVKSRDTADVAAALAAVLSPECVVLTVQNGLRNMEILGARLGRERVTGGVVTYNVYVDERGRRRQASRGKLIAGRLPGAAGQRLRELVEAFRRAGETLELRDDVDQVLAGKLLLNLSNGVCAATGLGLAAVLGDRDARICFVHALREGLRWMARAGLHPARVQVLPPGLMLLALVVLPDAVVSRLARALGGIGGSARLSTLQDLDRGRPTEIGEINGAIVRLAEGAGGSAPVNGLITRVVQTHEQAALDGRLPDYLPPWELRARIERVLVTGESG